MSQPDILLSAHDLHVVVGTRPILENINLALQPHQVTTIIGPNGGGKSTLLKALLGLIAPTRGQVWRRPGLRIGYMPQAIGIPPTLPLTVGRFLTLYKEVTASVIEAGLVEVGLAPTMAAQPFASLSGGEKQRVLLAQALLSSPELLVLDEPVQNVDIGGQAVLYQLIERVAQQRQCSVLLVSHDLHFVLASSHHVICLNRHICCAGHPTGIQQHIAYQTLFGETAPSLAPYIHHHDHKH